jgi:ATP synthase protein I
MTTESTQAPRGAGAPGGVGVLLGAAVAAVVLGLLLTVVGAVTGGPAAAFGALAGTLLVVGVFAFGSVTVSAVTGLAPAASLLVALTTYTLQVVVMGLVFVALSRSGLLEETLDRRWIGGAVIAGTLAWLVAQVALVTRARIPAYDLTASQTPATSPEAGAR